MSSSCSSDLLQACREYGMATRGALLAALRAEATSYLEFGLREPHRLTYMAPVGLWTRIKQVFAVPVFRPSFGEVEVAMLVAPGFTILDSDRVAARLVAERVCAAGIHVRFLEYQK